MDANEWRSECQESRRTRRNRRPALLGVVERAAEVALGDGFAVRGVDHELVRLPVR
jgi:hypothetical protein